MEKETILYLMQAVAKIVDKRFNCSTFVYQPVDEDGGDMDSIYLDVVYLADLPLNRLRPTANFEILHSEIEQFSEDGILGEVLDTYYLNFTREADRNGR